MLTRARSEKAASRILPLFLIFCIVNLPYLSNFVLSVDDESAAVRGDPAPWISQGRWTVYLVELLWLPQPSVVFLPGAIFGICVVIAYLLLLDAHNIRLPPARIYLLFTVFAAFPTWFFIMEFYANLPAVGVGLALASFSALCFARLTDPHIRDRDRHNIALTVTTSVLALAVAVGAYQSFILFGGSAFAGIMLLRHIRIQPKLADTLKTATIAAALLIMAALVYYGLLLLFLWATGRSVSYIGSFFDLGNFLRSPWPIIRRSLQAAFDVYGGSARVYGQAAWIFAVLVLGAIAALILASMRIGLAGLGMRVLLFVIALLFPFLMHLTAGGHMPYRSMVAIPYAMLLCTFVLSQAVRLQAVQIVIAILVVVESAYSTSLFNTSNDLVFDYDRALASRIYDRIVEVHSDFDRTKPYKVNFVGALPFETVYPSVNSSTAGKSFFEWDGGNPSRILTFMKILGYSNLTMANTEEAAGQAMEFVRMPLWPAKGSVRLVGDITLIRLGESPGTAAHAAMVEALVRQPFLAAPDRVLYRLDQHSFEDGDWVNNAEAIYNPEGLQLRAGPDPQLFIPVSAKIAECRTLQITIEQDLEAADMPRAFVLRRGETSFGPHTAAGPQAAGTGRTSLFFRSETGFMPRIRIDPGDLPQTYLIHQIAVGCVD